MLGIDPMLTPVDSASRNKRVRITLGRRAQVQNIAVSLRLMLSCSQPSRCWSKILLLNLIFVTFDTSISNLCLLRALSIRSSSCPSRGLVLRPSAPRHHGVLGRIVSDTSCNDIASTCSITPMQWRCWGLQCWSSRGLYWSVGERELESLSGPFTSCVPCEAFNLSHCWLLAFP